MAKRMIMMLAIVAAFIGGITFVLVRQIQGAVAHAAAFRPPPEAVTTVVAQQSQWDATLEAIGTVVAVHGVVVSADLPGVVQRIAFESGAPVQEGSVLVELDTRQERAQLAAAEAERELARLDLERMRGLRAKGVTSQAELDRATAGAKQADARAEEIRATIERKTIRAPFTGILGIRQANLGQYLNSGDPVVPLQTLHPIHVDFTVPQSQVEHLRLGAAVDVTAKGAGGMHASGRLTAVDSIVDEATRNVRVQATLDNHDGALRPGMFAQVVVQAGVPHEVVTLPASAISYAPYGNSVFIVEQMQAPHNGPNYQGVRQQFVQLGDARGDQVAIVSGVKIGDEVVTSGAFKLRNGAAVVVNNQVQPSNNPAPEPEDS